MKTWVGSLLGLAALGGAVLVVGVMPGAGTSLDVGDPAPAYSAPDLEGREVSLQDQRGAVVMINVWATWCGPCRVEMPSIQALYDRYRDRGFTVLAISIDASRTHEAQVRDFVSELDLGFPILLDPENRVSRVFQLAGVPETFVLDREGRIVKRVIGVSDWDSESNRALIEELLRM